jgi:hypothetical protein
VALGPNYGSVKVDGLNVAQAQNEIRQKLSQFATTPDGFDVQALIVSWHNLAPSVQQAAAAGRAVQQLWQERSALQNENLELKKKLEQRRR